MISNKFIEQLKEMKACQEALKWIESRDIDTVQEFWRVSNRGDWMLWLVINKYPGINIDTRTLQDLAIEFTIMALPYAGKYKQVCIDYIYASWQYLEGYIDIDELKVYRKVAYWVAEAALAADAVRADWSVDAVADAGWAATWAAARSADWAADCEARMQIRKWQADTIRQFVPEV